MIRTVTKIQPGKCNPAKTKRSPFADITNAVNSRMGSQLHTELAQPSRPPRETAVGIENNSNGSEAYCHLSGAAASVQHQRPSTVSHFRSESLEHISSRRLNCPETHHPHLHIPELDVYPYATHVPPCDLPATETPPLPSLSEPSTREPLSTSLLSSKTHKLAHGQLVILPSRSVLVDFREGERKKGKKGDEVMVVSPIGDKVKSQLCDRKTLLREIEILLYSAPHLSTPCCLAEPIATYSLNELPADWYRLYEQAKKVIEHIKRNVTKVRFQSDTMGPSRA